VITLAKNPHGLMATRIDEPRITALAGALYVANAAYTEALKMPNTAAALDDICDALPEVLPQVLGVIKTTPELTEVLKDAIADRLWAYTAIEYSRTEAGDGYGYIFDLMVEALEKGANPHDVRTTALDVPRRIRDLAEQAGGDR
jgi:hypothetical protein